MSKERDVELSSEDKGVVHEVQAEDVLEDNKVISTLEDTRGQRDLSSWRKGRLIPSSGENRLSQI